jgi:hypothetical protein
VVRVPPSGSLAVCFELHLVKKLLVGVQLHQVPDFPAKPYGKFASVRGLDNLG